MSGGEAKLLFFKHPSAAGDEYSSGEHLYIPDFRPKERAFKSQMNKR